MTTFFFLGLMNFVNAHAALDFTPIPETYSFEQKVVSIDENSLNTVVFKRLALNDYPNGTRGTIILLGGSGMEFDSFLHSDAAFEDSFAGYLASKGFVVYGMRPREFNYLDHCKENGRSRTGVDCKGARDWGMESALSDIDGLIKWAETTSPGVKPIIGGISLGAIQTFSILNRWPQRFSGALIWEGMAYTDRPEMLEANKDECARLEKQISKGEYITTMELQMFQLLARRAAHHPERWSPLGLLLGMPLANNRQVLVAAASKNLGDPPILGDKYQYLIASEDREQFKYTSLERAHLELAAITPAISIPITRDIHCTLANPRADIEVFPELKNVEVPVLAFLMELGMGEFADATLDLFTNTQVTRYLFRDFAHADMVFSNELMKEKLFPAIDLWLE